MLSHGVAWRPPDRRTLPHHAQQHGPPYAPDRSLYLSANGRCWPRALDGETMSWLSRLLGADNNGDIVDQDVIEDLLTFEEENDMLLPNNLTAEDIARFEAMGYVVDLVTGQLILESEADDYGVPNV